MGGEFAHASVIEQLVQLTHKNMKSHAKPEALSKTNENLSHKSTRLIIVWGNDKAVLGFAAYRTNSREGGRQTTFLYELQLAVSARGKKPSLAKALISEVENWACLLGRGRLMLHVHMTNLLAFGFYECCGFSKVCEVEDCIVMEKMCLLEAPAQLLEAPAQLLEAQGPSSAAYRALACSPLLQLPALRLLLRSGASNPTTSLKASWKDPHLSTTAAPPLLRSLPLRSRRCRTRRVILTDLT